ncbi:MAG: zf-TFIIB domain-containing protein [Patescibacteria group bacterium]|nr:zf-TFIIB domain-containing protein [Patescibacteria group bacterium]
MLCPNCNQPMNLLTADGQTFLHCSNCGSSFFEKNSINKISLETAKKIAEDRLTDEVFGQEKHCPKDGEILKPITDQPQVVSSEITLLRCQKCAGIFAFSEDLVNFKEQQQAKLSYFKAFKKAISFRTIFVLSVLGIISATLVTQGNNFLNYLSSRSQASSIVKKADFYRSGRLLLIFFRTETPFFSKIIFSDKTTGQKLIKMVSETPKTFHQLTTSDLNLDNEIWYQIVLTDNSGKEVKTEVKKIIINNE